VHPFFWWLLVEIIFKKNELPLELILKKSCMPKTKSRSDLEITYSYAKNTISHLGTEEGKMVANHTHFKN